MNAPARNLYLECTSTFRFDNRTGIQRVVRNVVRHFHRLAPSRGFTVIPVYFEDGDFFAAALSDGGELVSLVGGNGDVPVASRARRVLDAAAARLPKGRLREWVSAPSAEPGLARLARRVLGPAGSDAPATTPALSGAAPVVIGAHDVLVVVDLTIDVDMRARIEGLRAQGTYIAAIVNDLIPLRLANMLPATFVQRFSRWAETTVRGCDAIFTISRATERDIEAFRARLPPGSYPRGQVIIRFAPGCDMDRVAPSGPIRPALRALFGPVPVLLYIGWFDPRKNHPRLIEAFARLRARGLPARLLLVGKRGFGTDAVLAAVDANPDIATDIHVFHDLDDAEVEYAFAHSRALVYPSLIEGFGLPLVEALTRGLPVHASDIPVFREIGGDHIVYFDPEDAASIADSLEPLLHDGAPPAARRAPAFTWPSWEQSVAGLFGLLMELVHARPDDVDTRRAPGAASGAGDPVR